jgi:hypothetical protein
MTPHRMGFHIQLPPFMAKVCLLVSSSTLDLLRNATENFHILASSRVPPPTNLKPLGLAPHSGLAPSQVHLYTQSLPSTLDGQVHRWLEPKHLERLPTWIGRPLRQRPLMLLFDKAPSTFSLALPVKGAAQRGYGGLRHVLAGPGFLSITQEAARSSPRSRQWTSALKHVLVDSFSMCLPYRPHRHQHACDISFAHRLNQSEQPRDLPEKVSGLRKSPQFNWRLPIISPQRPHKPWGNLSLLNSNKATKPIGK